MTSIHARHMSAFRAAASDPRTPAQVAHDTAMERLIADVDNSHLPVCPECRLPMQFVPADDQGDAAGRFGEWRTKAGYACENNHWIAQEVDDGD